MRKIYISLFSLLTLSLFSQLTYPSLNINLLSHLDPESADAGDGRNYSGCWGWYQSSKNKEYALVGSSAKTYFIDVTNPMNPKICDSVYGHSVCTWRELKTYQNYCYVVSDVCTPNGLQIIDMQYLPDSVHVVYDDSLLFERAHTVWVDGNKMYVGGNAKRGSGTTGMNVYSLANPTAPVLLRKLGQDFSTPAYVHDMFVIHDTVYASGGFDKLYVFKFNNGPNNFSLLGSLTSYPESDYNHSSWRTPNGKTLVFCDERVNLSIKVADVTDLSNISISSLMRPNMDPGFIAHNPYVVSNEWVYVSCYQDGLLLYDISTPSSPTVKGFFDTYPQGGSGVTTNYGGACCRGNWGAYPYLPSGIVIACDMQNGIFLLKPSSIIGVKEENKNELSANISPNPATDKLSITFANDDSKTYNIEVTNVLGDTVYSENNLSDCGFPVVMKNLDLSNYTNGTYLISIKTDKKTFQQKFIIAK